MFYGVYCPAKDDLFCVPGGVAFAELFKRDGILPCDVVLVIRAKEFVEWRGRDATSSVFSLLPPLGFTDEIIDVYLNLC